MSHCVYESARFFSNLKKQRSPAKKTVFQYSLLIGVTVYTNQQESFLTYKTAFIHEASRGRDVPRFPKRCSYSCFWSAFCSVAQKPVIFQTYRKQARKSHVHGGAWNRGRRGRVACLSTRTLSRSDLSRRAAVVRVVPICRSFIKRHLMATRHRDRGTECNVTLKWHRAHNGNKAASCSSPGFCFIPRWTSRVICHAFWPSPISSWIFFSASGSLLAREF